MTERLYRSRNDRMVAGVAGGVAQLLNIDPSLIRVAWVILVPFTGGIAILVYVVMAFVVPEEPVGAGVLTDAGADASASAATGLGDTTVSAAPATPRGRGSTGLVLGLALIVTGSFFLLEQLFPALDLGRLWPLALIGVGAFFVFAASRPR